MTDSTILLPHRQPLITYTGVEGSPSDPASLLTGQTPLLLLSQSEGSIPRAKPHLMQASWFWVSGSPPRPVRRVDLERALFEGEGYHPEVIAALDRNNDKKLDPEELRLDTPERVRQIADRLRAVGVSDPRIHGEIQPLTVSHGVGLASQALKECTACHSKRSRLCDSAQIAPYAPGGIIPTVANDAGALLPGPCHIHPESGVVLRSSGCPPGLSILGAQAMHLLDWVGLFAVATTIIGSAVHGGIRYAAWRRRRTLVTPPTMKGENT